MIVTIHQPEHLPWLGFFEKTATANILVLLDTVQYRKNYFQNRNRIHVNGQILWITVPVKRKSRVLIKDTQIDNSRDWKRRYWNKIHHGYARTPFFREYSPFLENALNRSWERLAELNTHLLSELLTILGIKTQIVKASELNVTGDQQTLLLNLCRKLNAREYLSGISGREYLNTVPFEDAGIKVRFQEFYHPIYPQPCEQFVPCLSVIDLLFLHGEKAMHFISGSGVPRLSKLFH